MTALVLAGSGGEAFMISDASGQSFIGNSQTEAVRHFRELKSAGESFIGLTQIPISKMNALGLHPELAMDVCGNLEIGYYLLIQAHEQALKIDKSPWKALSITYSVFRSGKPASDSTYAQKAVDYLMSGTTTAPAPLSSSLHHGILAEWSAALATRQAARYSSPRLAPLIESAAITAWARKQY
jgi:hypothetical protein